MSDTIDRVELNKNYKGIKILRIFGVILTLLWVGQMLTVILQHQHFRWEYLKELGMGCIYWIGFYGFCLRNEGLFIAWRANEIIYKTHTASGKIETAQIQHILIRLDEIEITLKNEECHLINIERFTDYSMRMKIKKLFGQVQQTALHD